jgi:ribosomal protein S18 acetylase RimI-like enzyme
MSMLLPDIPGISSRPFSGPADFQHVADIFNADAAGSGGDWVSTAEEVALAFENQENLDVLTGLRFVEVDGEPIGYVVVRWMQEVGGPRIYRHMCKLRPDWIGRRIGTSMLAWGQQRLREIAAAHDFEPKVYRTNTETHSEGLAALLERNGYKAIEHEATLVRPDLEDIPEASLPVGLEIRPVTEDQLRTIFDADIEAFRDHWGFVEPEEGDWVQFLQFSYRDETLWKVAWDGDRVAGQVRSFINTLENESFGRRRGWTEFISTAQDWRGQGLATALICESLRELKQRGMEEAALGVHVENPHGAMRLYEKLGFVVQSRGAVYEKPWEMGSS